MAYGTNTGMTDWAASVGVTISDGADLDVARVHGTNYVNGPLFWSRYKGSPVDQYGDAFPRDGLSGVTGVPERVEFAAYAAGAHWLDDPSSLTSGSVSNNGSGAIASEAVDVIKVSYHAPMSDDGLAENAVIDNMPRFSDVEAYLTPFLSNGWYGRGTAFVI